ncbi:glycosyltransferase family 4 protein [Flavitalea sp.]|nr:glycosyltransferase family 4 protein [Flavitalea sp.]
MKSVILHPTGNANVRAAAIGFKSANILSQFYTSIATFEGDWLDKLSAFSPLSELKRRRFDHSLRSMTSTWPWRETGRLISGKAGYASLTKHESGLFCVDAVYHSIDKHVAAELKRAKKNGAEAVYAYEDGAAATFQQAKRLGLRCFYDLPIGYWKTGWRLLEAEANKWPDWAETLVGITDSKEKLDRKDQELMLADQIYVASTFTAKTLGDFTGHLAPVEVIPYGYPDVTPGRKYPGHTRSRKLKLLFVGRLEQRKGIANMFKAVAALGDYVELTVVGMKSTNDCKALDTALNQHKYISNLPHEDILKLMRESDVLLFPSLFEGFGLVITESMSQGTPVITTERTAGPDLISNDNNGWLTTAGETESLQAALDYLLCNPARIAANGKAAMESARLRPWQVYGRELADSILNNA